MSYDISLLNPITREPLELDFPHHMRGGTYAIGGTTRLELNITYNYSKYYYKYFGEKGIRTLYGMTGAESIPILQEVIEKLNNDTTNDYWEGTEGNAKQALLQLLALAKMRPDGIWDGD
jgi:hypothetical protein